MYSVSLSGGGNLPAPVPSRASSRNYYLDSVPSVFQPWARPSDFSAQPGIFVTTLFSFHTTSALGGSLRNRRFARLTQAVILFYIFHLSRFRILCQAEDIFPAHPPFPAGDLSLADHVPGVKSR